MYFIFKHMLNELALIYIKALNVSAQNRRFRFELPLLGNGLRRKLSKRFVPFWMCNVEIRAPRVAERAAATEHGPRFLAPTGATGAEYPFCGSGLIADRAYTARNKDAQTCWSIQPFSVVLGCAPTCWEATWPSLNMISVGIPRMP